VTPRTYNTLSDLWNRSWWYLAQYTVFSTNDDK